MNEYGCNGDGGEDCNKYMKDIQHDIPTIPKKNKSLSDDKEDLWRTC